MKNKFTLSKSRPKRRNHQIIERQDYSDLESLLIKDDFIWSAPAQDIRQFSSEQIQSFCHDKEVYCVITNELIEFLSLIIAGKSAIDICSGNGTIGRCLGIPMIDRDIYNSV